MYSIEEIEDGIINTLKRSDVGTWCRKIETLSVDLEKDLEKLTLVYPACYVIYDLAEYINQNIGVQDKKGIFGVVVVARNLRGNAAARRGQGTDEKGAYEILDKVRSVLSYSNLGLNIQSCLPQREIRLKNTLILAAYGIEFEIKWRFNLS